MPSERTHPYTVHTALLLGSNIELLLDGDRVEVPFGGNCSVKFKKKHLSPRDQANYLTPVDIDLHAFSSASEADRAGKLFAFSLLWFAASSAVTISFRRRTGDYPFAVRDRTRGSLLSANATAFAFRRITPEALCSIAGQAFDIGRDVSPSLFTSMEFFAASRLETTDRACFVTMMTALEALATQSEYGDEVESLLSTLAQTVHESPIFSADDPDKMALRNSLSGRIRDLRRESVRQAIIRAVKSRITDENVFHFVDEAYAVRSKILHEGHRAEDLHSIIQRLESVMRQIYSAELGLPLATPIPQSQ